MSNYVQESYKPFVISGTGTTTSPSNGIGGFLCTASGTITIQTNDPTPKTIIPTLAVTAGIYYPMPFQGSHQGIIVTSAAGAAGTLGVH